MNKFTRTCIVCSFLLCFVAISSCGGGGGGTNDPVPLSSAKAITAFSFSSPIATGVINESAKTVSVTVPYGTNVTALVASFATTGASVHVGSTIQVSGTTPNNFTNPVTYTVTAADSSTATYTVTVTVSPSTAKAITFLSFSSPAATGIINESAKTISVTVPYGTNVTALVASFATTGASVHVGSTVQVSGTTPNNFTNPVTYTVTAADSSTATYTVTVTVSPSTAKAITAFSFSSPAATGVIDESIKTISVIVPNGTNVIALVASFMTTGTSVKIGSTVQVSNVTSNDFTNPVNYIVTAADGSTVTYTVTVTVAPSSSKIISSYSLLGEKADINEAAKTISIVLPHGTNVMALTATFSTTGASIKVGSIIQISGVTPNDFTSPVLYTVIAEDASTVTYTITVQLAAVSLPKTGQTSCYDTVGVLISCAGTSQDGATLKGITWTPTRFTNMDGTRPITGNVVYDNLTGLIWTTDANTPGPVICSPATMKTWQGALDYISCLNNNNYLGYTDWRLPNVIELTSTLNYELSLVVNWRQSVGFINVQGYYWTSTSYSFDKSSAWTAATYIFSDNKTNLYPVWPVRGGNGAYMSTIDLAQTGQSICSSGSGTVINCSVTGQDGDLKKGVSWPSPRFTNIDGTTPIVSSVVVDQLTGLMWTKDGNAPGPCNYSGMAMYWENAVGAPLGAYISCLNSNNYLGYNDWRVPNINELKSLINYDQANNATWLNGLGFVNVQPDYYFSSTTQRIAPSSAWVVNMIDGTVTDRSKMTNPEYIWPVRGGK